MTVIAITRELGTRGREVAEGIASRLRLELVHDEVIEQGIARSSGLGDDVVHRYFDGSTSLLEGLIVNERDLSKTSTEEVLELAAKGNVVIRGWGSSYLLQNVPHVLCVRICAPMSARERAVIERGLAADTDAARRLIEQRDAVNDRIMNRMFGRDGRDASGYSLVLNSARLGVWQCIDLIASAAANRRFQPTVQSQRALLDWLDDLRVYQRHTA